MIDGNKARNTGTHCWRWRWRWAIEGRSDRFVTPIWCNASLWSWKDWSSECSGCEYLFALVQLISYGSFKRENGNKFDVNIFILCRDLFMNFINRFRLEFEDEIKYLGVYNTLTVNWNFYKNIRNLWRNKYFLSHQKWDRKTIHL